MHRQFNGKEHFPHHHNKNFDMVRFKSEELEDFIPPSLDAPKTNNQPYLPKRREREWTRKRHNKIALMRLIHEVSIVDTRMYALFLILFSNVGQK
jgi:hypothetical protein